MTSVNIGFTRKSEGLSRPQTSNNRPKSNQRHWLKVPTNQFQQPTLTQEFQKPLFRTSWIRDVASNLIDYRCCRPYQKKTVRRTNFSQHIIT
jgi:hypothetical protein